MRMLQITEEDLAKLEREVPELCNLACFARDGKVPVRTQMKARIVKEILSNVRWDYGPPMEVAIIPAEGPPPNE